MFEVRSNVGPAKLVITPEERRPAGEYYMASLTGEALQASVGFYELNIGALGSYFQELADRWRGWKGERTWEALEDDVRLAASHDGLGTVRLAVRLQREPWTDAFWTAEGVLLLDAGGLDAVARAARQLL